LQNDDKHDERNTEQACSEEPVSQNSPQNDRVQPKESTSTELNPADPVFRFRRPVIADDYVSGLTESYETLTLSEVQQLDMHWDPAMQSELEKLHFALGDFDEEDEFQEVDEFEDDWEGVEMHGDYDIELDYDEDEEYNGSGE
jgi:hypothetical protein